MKLSQEQYDQLLAMYAESLVDGMDMDDLVQFAVEQIEMNLRESCSMDEELVEEINRIYDEEVLCDMLESVGANPADFDIDVTQVQVAQ